MHEKPTVDRNVGSCYIGLVVPGQKRYRRSDLLRKRHSSHRDTTDNGFPNVFAYGIGHGGLHVAGRYRVDGDSLGGSFLGKCHRESMHTGFRRRIVGLSELAPLAVERRYVDDAAIAAIQHAFPNGPCNVEDAVQIGLDNGIPLVGNHSLHGAVAGDAGAVDQYVNRAKTLLHFGHHARTVFSRRDITTDEADLQPEFLLGF